MRRHALCRAGRDRTASGRSRRRVSAASWWPVSRSSDVLAGVVLTRGASWHEGEVAGGGHGVADEPDVGYRADSAGHGRDGACPGRHVAEADVTYHPGGAGGRIHRTVDADVKDHGTRADVLGPD